jgi:acyl carrier protein
MNQKFVALVAELFDARACKLRPETRLKEDLELDSLDRVELFTAVEQEFGINLTDEEEETLLTLADVNLIILQRITPPVARTL